MTVPVLSAPPTSSYAFWSWLEAKEWSGNNENFVNRLMKDGMAPRAIGPRLPTTLMNYVMRQIDTPTGRAEYEARDIPTIWNLWNFWLSDRDMLLYEKGDTLEPLHATTEE